MSCYSYCCSGINSSLFANKRLILLPSSRSFHCNYLLVLCYLFFRMLLPIMNSSNTDEVTQSALLWIEQEKGRRNLLWQTLTLRRHSSFRTHLCFQRFLAENGRHFHWFRANIHYVAFYIQRVGKGRRTLAAMPFFEPSEQFIEQAHSN